MGNCNVGVLVNRISECYHWEFKVKFLVAGLISVFAISNSIAGESIFGGGSFVSESSQSSGDNYVKYDLARVVRIQPITTAKVYSVIRQSCTLVEDLSSTPPVAGGVVGAAQSKMIQRCIPYNDREYKQVINGYDVTFEYYGQIRTVRMENDPGDTVRVKTVTSVYVIQ
jgi:hypothetical protein